jgi:hypothetical protein
MRTNTELYEQDFFEWTHTTATLIRAGKWHDIDPERLAEELESLGQQDQREVKSHLQALLYQLLKWWAQPEERCGRWASAIHEQRHAVILILRDSPSLQAHIPTWLAEAYPSARAQALEDTRLYTLPEECPFTPAQVLDTAFWPESPTLTPQE